MPIAGSRSTSPKPGKTQQRGIEAALGFEGEEHRSGARRSQRTSRRAVGDRAGHRRSHRRGGGAVPRLRRLYPQPVLPRRRLVLLRPNLHTPIGWLGPLVIASPAIGGLVVIFLDPQPARGPARPGRLRHHRRDLLPRGPGARACRPSVKSLAAGMQSGTGGSVGREAAIVQIGAALASRISRLPRIAQWQRMTLVAAGGAAGLAAAFNAPSGSIVFAIELMMPEISAAHAAAGDDRGRRRHVRRRASSTACSRRSWCRPSPPRICASPASSRCCPSSPFGILLGLRLVVHDLAGSAGSSGSFAADLAQPLSAPRHRHAGGRHPGLSA